MGAIKITRLRYILVALAIVVTPVLLWKIIQYPISLTPAPATFAPATSQAQANRQDLGYLSNTLHRIDRSFSAAAWAQFDEAIGELMQDAGKLNPAEFEMGVARALAFADNGHTNVRAAGWGLTLNAIPLRFGWFAEGLFVVATDPAHQDLLGAQVLTENGHPPEYLADVFRSYVGGPDSLAREVTPHFMKSPGALHAVGLADSPLSVQLALRWPDGRSIERTVAADPHPANGPRVENLGGRDPRERWPRRDLSPSQLPNTLHPWVHILNGRTLPLSLQHLDKFYWQTRVAGGDVVYIQINATADQPGHLPLETFLQQTIDEIAAHPPQKIVLDLRANSGGNYALTADFTRKVPQALPRDSTIAILTTGNTFSAAIVTAARLKHFADGRAAIVGEPMGDREQFWAEAAARITLPNSRLVATYATGYHDWERGCSLSQLFICAPENLYLGVAAGRLTPDVIVQWSFPDYLNSQDTALNTALRATPTVTTNSFRGSWEP